MIKSIEDIEILEGNIYKVSASRAGGQTLEYVMPVSNRIRDEGFDGQFYYRGRFENQKYSFLNYQVIERVCRLSEIREIFPEDYL